MNHGGAVQRVEVDRLVEPMYAMRKGGKGGDVHLNAWACLEFQSKSQDGVCLTALCVCEEKDFSHRRSSVLGGDPVEALVMQTRRVLRPLGIMGLPSIRDLR